MAETPFNKAQGALTDLKTAVHELLSTGPEAGMTNAEIGHSLGIYAGHKGHEGHIPRTILALLESDGVVEQDSNTKRWRVRSRPSEELS